MDNIILPDGFYPSYIVCCERNRCGWWNINTHRYHHRCIYSAASPVLQILAVLEKIQGLMVRCFSGKQIKNNFGLESITYNFHG